jgi:Tfp pilus assembly pilus retraction ATPase PilT
MELLDRILSAGHAARASDVHLKAGGVPVFRIHRELRFTNSDGIAYAFSSL